MTREQAKREIDNIDFYLQHHTDDYSERSHDAMMMAIQALENHDTFMKYAYSQGKQDALSQEPCDDAISRDAVLSIIDGWYEQNRETENIEDLIILITYMDSVTPKSRECEDVISRAEVKRIVDFYKEQYDGIYHINESIDNLPSVTHKSGKWIAVTNGRGGHECSLCHEYAPSYQDGDEWLTKYCPNCGAKMEREEISERNMKMWEEIFKAERSGK